MACSESLPSTYPGFPLERASRSTACRRHPGALGLHGVVKTTCCSWPCADVAERRCPRNRRSRCSGAAWWTPGGAYIEHARVAEVTGELLPAQPGLQPGLIVVVVVVEVVVAPPPDDERSPCHTLLAAATATATAATAAAAAARPPPPPPMHVACMSYE